MDLNCFSKIFHAAAGSCWRHCEWRGDALVCAKCGEVIALRHPKVFNAQTYEYCPLLPQALEHRDEIMARCGLVPGGYGKAFSNGAASPHRERSGWKQPG